MAAGGQFVAAPDGYSLSMAYCSLRSCSDRLEHPLSIGVESWLWRDFGADRQVLSPWLDHPGPQEVDVGTPVHLALDELEPGHLSLRLSVGPGLDDGGPHSGLVSPTPEAKDASLLPTASRSQGEIIGLLGGHHGPESIDEVARRRDLRVQKHIDGAAALEIADDGSISLALELGEIVDADHADVRRRGWCAPAQDT